MIVSRLDSVDLHLHTTLSDGAYPPSRMVAMLAEAGISTACFTDHNSVHPRFAELQDYARRRHDVWLPFPATEVTAVYRDPSGRDRGYTFHILAYGEGVLDPRFRKWLSKPNGRRRAYLFGVYETLLAQGFDLPPFERIYRTADPVEALDCEQLLCMRSPLARAVAAFLGISPEEAKERHVPRQPTDEPQDDRLDAFELIEWANRLGFALVIAHPGRLRDISASGRGSFEDQLEVIIELIRLGVDGVEVRHRRNSAEHVAVLKDLARRMDLLTTGGSDFHGRPDCVLGLNAASRAEFERLSVRIREKRRVVECCV